MCAALSFYGGAVWPQGFRPEGTVRTPESGIRTFKALISGREEDARAYTNIQIFEPVGAKPAMLPKQLITGKAYVETPASIACIYRLVPQKNGCNPRLVKENSTGGSKVIVIVSAYHAPNIQNDLRTFSTEFGLPQTGVEVINGGRKRPIEDPTSDKGWEIETSLDVQWAHAIAPKANLVLVEAESWSYRDLLTAIDVANKIIAQYGGGQISLSWSGGEFSRQSHDSSYFSQKGATYFAASGNNNVVSFPATLAQVVAVGGTSIERDSTGKYLGETAWIYSGAGESNIERVPIYQSGLPLKNRGTVDIAAIADTEKGGVLVYASNPAIKTNGGWLGVGGTSAATVIVAAIANRAGISSKPLSSTDLLARMYQNMKQFADIAKGSCGKHSASAGWDFCTGVGTPNGVNGF